ncbi:aminotransferase class III-fold pyridoxal phosphate-dependent enzyme, partial [candidate division WOR-3 bacterium]|nr:aminotransferase class III-fold pyridoxal phosphate-dependent enzyme [candidate division WOR-3 bacterium]
IGQKLMAGLAALAERYDMIADVRGKGLMIGVVIKESSGTARSFCEKLRDEGILAKETHHQVIRFAPPLVITKEEIDWALERIKKVLLFR